MCILLKFLMYVPSTCQKLLKLKIVKICQSYDKNNFDCFFFLRHGVVNNEHLDTNSYIGKRYSNNHIAMAGKENFMLISLLGTKILWMNIPGNKRSRE